MGKWLDKLEATRATFDEDAYNEEAVLADLIFNAILDFIERDDYVLVLDLHDEGYDPSASVCEWVDA